VKWQLLLNSSNAEIETCVRVCVKNITEEEEGETMLPTTQIAYIQGATAREFGEWKKVLQTANSNRWARASSMLTR